MSSIIDSATSHIHELLHVRFKYGLERPNDGYGWEALAAPIPCGIRRDLALESAYFCCQENK